MIGWIFAIVDVVLAVLFGVLAVAFGHGFIWKGRDSVDLLAAGIFAIASVATLIQGVQAA